MIPVTASIHVGHVLDVLRRMPAESVHTVITSPPYWGLRIYGTEPQIWDGDHTCDHDWQSIIKPAANGMIYSEMQDRREGGSLNNMSATRRPNISSFCVHCGAWRGDLGLEPTFGLYVQHIVEVFREVRRVLRPEGTLWLNMGDCYATGAGSVGEHPGGGEQGARWKGYRGSRPESPLARSGAVGPMTQPNRIPQDGLKAKDLVMMPERVALALQTDGWWLRSKIVWAKGISFLPGYSGSVMPESMDDRPTRAYELVFLLTKSADYFCDMDAIREPFSEGTYDRLMQGTFDQQSGGAKDYRDGTNPSRSVRKAAENLRSKILSVGVPDPQATLDGQPHSRTRNRMRRDVGRDEQGLRTSEKMGHSPGWRARVKTAENPHMGGRRQAPEPGEPNAFHPLGRNVRDVWVINPEPFDYEACRACGRVYDGREYAMLVNAPRDGDAPPKKICRCGRFDEWLSHFAVFPQALVLPCVLAGTSECGCCLKCGAPWERMSESTGHLNQKEQAHVPGNSPTKTDSTGWAATKRATNQWRPTCSCKQGTGPCAVLDPFAGSGTTLLVAAKNGRHAVGIELQEDYIPIIRRRLADLETDLIHPTLIEVL